MVNSQGVGAKGLTRRELHDRYLSLRDHREFLEPEGNLKVAFLMLFDIINHLIDTSDISTIDILRDLPKDMTFYRNTTFYGENKFHKFTWRLWDDFKVEKIAGATVENMDSVWCIRSPDWALSFSTDVDAIKIGRISLDRYSYAVKADHSVRFPKPLPFLRNVYCGADFRIVGDREAFDQYILIQILSMGELPVVTQDSD